MPRTGKCACGAIAFDVKNDTTAGVICYCGTCRTITSDHSFNLKIARDEVVVTQGTPKEYVDKSTNSGKPMSRFFCGDCGTALWSDPSASPDARFLKVGALSDAHDVGVAMELYCDVALKHEPLPKGKFGQKQFEGPTMKEIK